MRSRTLTLTLLFALSLSATVSGGAGRSAADKIRDLKLQDPHAEQAILALLDSRDFFDLPSVCNGRLTTESGQAISTSNRSSQGTLYFTPFRGSSVALFTGGRWKLYNLTERSLALSISNNTNYDVFLYDNAGTLTLELSAAWASSSARTDAIVMYDGVYVKVSDMRRRYLGTIRGSGANVTEDSATKRFVWNYYNRVPRTLTNTSSTSHTYASSTFRPFNNSTTNQVEWVIGETQGYYVHIMGSSENNSEYGVGLDSTSSPTMQYAHQNGTMTTTVSDMATVSSGYHYIVPLESATTGTVTFSSFLLTGIVRG
jgi:hypothetical protein